MLHVVSYLWNILPLNVGIRVCDLKYLKKSGS